MKKLVKYREQSKLMGIFHKVKNLQWLNTQPFSNCS